MSLEDFDPTTAVMIEEPAEPLRFRARATGYYPVSPDAGEAERRMEGGNVGAGEWHGRRLKQQEPLYSLEDYQAGKAPYVSVAMDNSENNPLTYGTILHSPEFPGVRFRVHDTGSAFNGSNKAKWGEAKGLTRIDIRRGSAKHSQQDNRDIEFVVGEPQEGLDAAYAAFTGDPGPAIGAQEAIDEPSKVPPMWEAVQREKRPDSSDAAAVASQGGETDDEFDPATAVLVTDDEFDPTTATLVPDGRPMSRDEFAGQWREQQHRSLLDKANGVVEGVGQGIRGIVQQVADSGSEVMDTPGALKRLPATMLEGLARGTYDLGDLVRRIGNNDQVKTLLALLNPSVVTTPQWQDAAKASIETDPEKVIDREYQKYLENQGWEQQRAAGMDGQGNLAPKWLGEPLPKTAEAASLVLDPTVIIPAVGQAGELARAGRRIIGAAVKPAATAAEVVGRTGANAIEAAGERAAAMAAGAGASPEAIKVASRLAGAGSLATEPARVAAKATEAAGQAARAVVDEVATAPSQLAVAERIARDATKPGWLRRAANVAAKVPEAARRAPGLALEGGIQGAATGGILAIASGQDAEGIGRGIGSGGLLGAGGAIVGYHLPKAKEARQIAAENGDVLWALGRQWDLGGDVDRLSKLPREQLVQISSLQRVLDNTTDIVFVPREQFQARAPRERAAGVYIDAAADGRSRIVVNLDAHTQPARAVTHEIAHAILSGPAVNKDPVRLAISRIYNEPQLDAMGREYARRTLEAERQALPPALPPPKPIEISPGLAAELGIDIGTPPPLPRDPRRITRPEVEERFQELKQSAIDSGDIDGRDWIRDEVFAEHFASEMDGKGLKLDHIRRGVVPGADGSRLQEALLNARAKVLQTFGVPFDQTGRIAQPTSQIFRDNPLMRDKNMQRLVGQVARDRMAWLSGLAKRDESPDSLKGAPLVSSRGVSELAHSPAVEWRPHKDGFMETDFAVKRPDGQVTLKPEKEIARVEADRAVQARALVPGQMLPADSPDFGRKRIDGQEVIGGRTLPARFDKYYSFPQQTREAARAMEQKRDTGETFSTWYHQIGSGADGSWAKSVRKNLGNVRATQRELSLVSWHLSKAGNIYGKMLDVGSARARAFELQNQGKLDSLWGGNVDAFQRDVMTYLANHAEGKPGETGIGAGKRDFINGFFGVTTKANKSANPVYSGKLGRSLIKSFRLDRMHNVEPTGRTGWSVDYDRMKHNLLPDAPPDPGRAFSLNDGSGKAGPLGQAGSRGEPLPDRYAASDLARDTWERLGHKNAPFVHVYESISEIPRVLAGDAARQAAADGSIVEAFYFGTKSGRRNMVIALDGLAEVARERKITVQQRIQEIALHEITHHYRQLGALFPEAGSRQYRNIVEGTLKRMSEKERQKLAELYGFNLNSPEGRAKLAEEALARFAETPGGPPGWVQRTIAEIRELLRQVFPDIPWTDADVRVLLDAARRRSNNAVAGA